MAPRDGATLGLPRAPAPRSLADLPSRATSRVVASGAGRAGDARCEPRPALSVEAATWYGIGIIIYFRTYTPPFCWCCDVSLRDRTSRELMGGESSLLGTFNGPGRTDRSGRFAPIILMLFHELGQEEDDGSGLDRAACVLRYE